jgi:hypothetical protein
MDKALNAHNSKCYTPPLEPFRLSWQQCLHITRTCGSWRHCSHYGQAGRRGRQLMWSLIVHTASTRWRGWLIEMVLAPGVVRSGGWYLKHKHAVATRYLATLFLFGVGGGGGYFTMLAASKAALCLMVGLFIFLNKKNVKIGICKTSYCLWFCMGVKLRLWY